MLGQISKEMGGDSSLSGGDGLTIQNNVNGNMLVATGDPSIISGVSTVNYKSTAAGEQFNVTASLNVTGANNYLYLQGTTINGEVSTFKVAVSGGILRIVES